MDGSPVGLAPRPVLMAYGWVEGYGDEDFLILQRV
jgi:hypothetical protein